MEGKKLNIELAENEAGACGEDNSLQLSAWDHFDNQLDAIPVDINALQGRLSELEIKTAVFDDKENLYKDKIKYMEDLIAALKLSIASSEKQSKDSNVQHQMKLNEIKLLENEVLIRDYKNQIETQSQTIRGLKKSNEDLTSKVSELENKKKNNKIFIYIPYGTSRKCMLVPGLEKVFVPTLEHHIAGPGWLVIQRRIDGKVGFEKSFDDYYNGFGDPKAEFWLGLEKLHKITNHQQHELYIRIMGYDDKTHYARYDNFVVGSQKEKFELKSLGKYSGDANDMMRLCQNQAFGVGLTTFKNGWWWYPNVIPSCNLNGKFTKTKIDNQEYMFWGLKEYGNKGNFIKSAQMLIRPKTNKTEK